MVVYAIFACLIHAQPGIGHQCMLLSSHPMQRAPNSPGEPPASAYTSLAACKRDLPYFQRVKDPIRVYVCLKETVPAWGPAE